MSLWSDTMSTGIVIDANTIFGSMWPLERRDISIEKLKRDMGRFEVNKAITLSARGIFYDHVLGNDETSKVCSEDTRFIPALTIDPRVFTDDDKEIEKRTLEGFRILRLFPEFQGFNIQSGHVRRMLVKAMESSLLLMMPVQVGIKNVLELLKELRELRIILGGIGYSEVAEIMVAMGESDNLFIETRLIDSVDGVDMLVEKFGADRLIFGSGAPLGYVGSSLNLIRHAHISEAEKRIILSGSIERLIGGA